MAFFDGHLFRSLVCPLLAPRSLHACALVRRDWTRILNDQVLWARWCEMLSLSSVSTVSACYTHFALLQGVRTRSEVVSLRLENGADTRLRLCCPGDAGFTGKAWEMRLELSDDGLLDLGSNWDTFTRLFKRGRGALRDELQTDLQGIMMDETRLRELGSILPTHDYDVAAFPVWPSESTAADVFQEALSGLQPSGGLGFDTVYCHAIPSPAAGSSRCKTHFVLAPLHDIHDATAVTRYEEQIREGHRPVALALCLGLPYNSRIHGGVDIGSILGYNGHDREYANLRALIQLAEGESAQALQEALQENMREYPPPSLEEQKAVRYRALECLDLGGDNIAVDFVRIGLCLILDGHHKMKAAANLGEAITLLCYGLQGTACTPQNVPHEFHGDAENLYFDSYAIFNAIAPDPT